MNVGDVNPDAPDLTEHQRNLLRVLIDMRMLYLERGRGREAHGMGSALILVWTSMKGLSHELPSRQTHQQAPSAS